MDSKTRTQLKTMKHENLERVLISVVRKGIRLTNERSVGVMFCPIATIQKDLDERNINWVHMKEKEQVRLQRRDEMHKRDA